MKESMHLFAGSICFGSAQAIMSRKSESVDEGLRFSRHT